MRQNIRKKIRDLRKQLSEKEQALAADDIAKLVNQDRQLLTNQVKKVGVYLANDGEINPSSITQVLWNKDIEVYLPILHPFTKGHLLFIRYHQSESLITNKYGIPEPKLSVLNIIPADQLDIVFTPLVAFDRLGHRLGMGGGYYDRTFAFTHNAITAKPLLIGLAHNCQQLDELPVEAWDVPLKQIITPSKHYQFIDK